MGCSQGPFRGIFSVLFIFVLSILIFYQVILALIFPLRSILFILILEIALLFFIMWRIIRPY